MSEDLQLMAESIRDAQNLLKEMNMHISDELKIEVALALFKSKRWKK